MLISSCRIARNAYTSVIITGNENPVCDIANTEINAPIPITARSFSRHRNSVGAALRLSG